MTSDLDELMNRDPLLLSAQDIDQIVAYQRKARANFEAGVKPKKDGPKADLTQVVQSLMPQQPKPLRRI